MQQVASIRSRAGVWVLAAATLLASPALAEEGDVAGLLRQVPAAPAHYAPNLGSAVEGLPQVDVHPETGRATLLELDLQLGGATIWRARSGDGRPGGLFGRGWRSLLDTQVTPHGEGLALLRPQGTSLFVPLREDVFVSIWGQVELLRRTPSGYDLATAGGRLLRFDRAGALAEVRPGFVVQRSADRLRLLTAAGDLAAELDLSEARVTTLRDAHGAELRYRYDEQGRLVAVSGALTRTYAHDANGFVRRVTTPLGALGLSRDGSRLKSLTRPGWTQTYSYDQGAAVETPRGTWRYRVAEDGWEVETPQGLERVWLDARGSPREIQSASGARGPYRRARDADPWPTALPGGPVERVYGKSGRLETVQGPGARETFAYDGVGRITSRTTVDGRTSRYTYNEAGRLASERAPEGTTRWSWTSSGRLGGVVTPGGRQWRLTWDAGRLTGESGPMGLVRWKRDAAGRPLQRQDASGRSIEYRYDAFGRPEQVRAGDQVLRLGYDEAGQLIAWSDGTRTEVQRRDDQGRLTVVRTAGLRLRYQHDAQSVSVETPWGTRRWERDEEGRVVRLDSTAGTFTFSYDSVGLRTGLRYPNGLEVELRRDDLGRVEALTAAGAAGAPLLQVRSRWSPRHERELRTTRTPAGSQTVRYDHDEAGRLSGWSSGAASWSTTYGGDGDRLTETRGDAERALGYDTQGRLVSRGDERFRYDAAGRLLERRHELGVDRFRYDAFGRLLAVQRAGAPQVTYGYDPLGRVARRRVGEATTRYVWEGQRLLAELGPGPRERVYVYGPDLDEPLAVREGGRWTYLVSDELHHLLLRVDAEGRPLEQVALSPWGEPLAGDLSLPIFFAGRLYDPVARLYPMRARSYDPELGRFLTPDPTGLRGGVNAYTYCRARPLDRIDPLGAWDWVPDWAARGQAWVEQRALPAVVDAGEFLVGYGEFVWEDVKSGAARDRMFGTVDAYASFLTLGLVDPHLSSLAGNPEEAARGRIYGEAAGWVFAIVSGRELIKQGGVWLYRGARALPSTIPRLPSLLRQGGQWLPGALARLPARGKAWAVALPGAAVTGSRWLWANKVALGESLNEFLRAQASQAWNVTGRPFVSLYEAVAFRGRQATTWLRGKTAAGRRIKATHGTASGTAGASPSTSGGTPADVHTGGGGSNAGIRDVIEGRGGGSGGSKPPKPTSLVKGYASVHVAKSAWLERRFASIVAAVRRGRTGPRATAMDVRVFLDETYEHINEVNELVRALGGKVRPIPLFVEEGTALRGIHDLGEAVSIRRMEAFVAELRRNPIMADGVPLEVPTWLARLAGQARAAGQTTVDVSKLNPHVAAGLSYAGKPDPFAIAVHRLSPHHSGAQGGGSLLIESVADMVNAMRQSRAYSPRPLPFNQIRGILQQQVAHGDLPREALPLIERALEAQRVLERSGKVNPYYLLESADEAGAAVNSAAGAASSSSGAATAVANVQATRQQVGRLLAELRKLDDSAGSQRALEALQEAYNLFRPVARAGNRTDQAILAGLRYEYQLMRVRLGQGSFSAYERLVGSLHAGLDASVPYHVTRISSLPGILRNGLKSGDGYGVYFSNPLTQEAAQLGRGGAVIRVKAEFEHLYRFERSSSAESLHGVVAVDAKGLPVDVIPPQHLEAVPLPMRQH